MLGRAGQVECGLCSIHLVTSCFEMDRLVSLLHHSVILFHDNGTFTCTCRK